MCGIRSYDYLRTSPERKSWATMDFIATYSVSFGAEPVTATQRYILEHCHTQIYDISTFGWFPLNIYYEETGTIWLTGDFSSPSCERQSNVAPQRSIRVPSCRTLVSSSTCNKQTNKQTNKRSSVAVGSWQNCSYFLWKTVILKN
jgi:hypothetical protein